MANKTTRMQLNVWQEHDIVDFNEINANFQKIDSCRICTETKTMNASYSGSMSGSLSWKVESYTDGSVEMLTKLDCSSLDLSTNKHVILNFPVSLTSIYDVHTNMATDDVSLCHAVNISDPTTLSSQTVLITRMGSANANQKVMLYVVVKGMK